MDFLTDYVSQIIALVQVGFIDLVMSGDNAIIIAMAAAGLTPQLRKKVILYGIGIAALMRVAASLGVSFLLGIPFLKIAGGIVLLWVAYKFLKGMQEQEAKDIKCDNNSFKNAVIQIALADASMSIDNVFAVAGASGEHYGIMVFGLVLSIVMMAFLSNYIAELLEKHKWIAWVGLFLIVFVAGKLIYHDLPALFSLIAAIS